MDELQTPILYTDLDAMCAAVRERYDFYRREHGPVVGCFVLAGLDLYVHLKAQARPPGFVGRVLERPEGGAHSREMLTLLGHKVLPWVYLPARGFVVSWSHDAEPTVWHVAAGMDRWRHLRRQPVQDREEMEPTGTWCVAQRGDFVCPCGGTLLIWQEG